MNFENTIKELVSKYLKEVEEKKNKKDDIVAQNADLDAQKEPKQQQIEQNDVSKTENTKIEDAASVEGEITKILKEAGDAAVSVNDAPKNYAELEKELDKIEKKYSTVVDAEDNLPDYFKLDRKEEPEETKEEIEEQAQAESDVNLAKEIEKLDAKTNEEKEELELQKKKR